MHLALEAKTARRSRDAMRRSMLQSQKKMMSKIRPRRLRFLLFAMEHDSPAQ